MVVIMSKRNDKPVAQMETNFMESDILGTLSSMLSFFRWPLPQNWYIFIPFPDVVHLPELVDSVIHRPLAREGAGDDEGDVDGVAAHHHAVERVEANIGGESFSE